MKFVASLAFLTVLSSGSVAQTLSTPTVIKSGVGAVTFLRFSPDGRELARITQFGPVELFAAATYRTLRTFPIGMRMVAYSPDGTRIATAEGTDGARVWDAGVRGEPIPLPPEIPRAEALARTDLDEIYVLDSPLKVLEVPGRDAKQRVFWAEFSPDGTRLITTQANGHVKVWNTHSWTVEGDVAVTTAEVRAAAFAPDGKTIVIGDINGVLHEWSTETKTEIRVKRAQGAVMGIAFAPDGTTLVTTHQSASGYSVVIWDRALQNADVRERFSAAAFSKDGKVLALGGSRIELIDATSRKLIRVIELPEMSLREANRRFENSPNADRKVPMVVRALAFSPDGLTLAAGCAEGTIRLVKIDR